MKINIILIILLFNSCISKQTIKETFILRVIPDHYWALEFDKDGTYKYYHVNLWGNLRELDKGKYTLIKDTIFISSIEKDSFFNNEIPSKLIYSKVSKEELDKMEENIMLIHKETTFLFRKRYKVLSDPKR